LNKEINTYDNWIREGYKYFATVGPVKFSLKELSRHARLSRTSLYYYFVSKEEFIDTLITHHYENIAEFNTRLQSSPALTPTELAAMLNEFATGVSFQYQLFRFRHIDRFAKAYLEGHEINIRHGLLAWLMQEFNISLPDDMARRVYFIFTDVLYTRLNVVIRNPEPQNKYSDLFLQTIADFKLMINRR